MARRKQSMHLKQFLEEPVALKTAMGDVYFTLQQENDYTLAKWYGNITADDVVKASRTFLHFQKIYPCSKLLNDKSESTGDWQEANDWLEFEWVPAAVAAGLRCMAHIYSQSMITNFSEHDFLARPAPHLQLAEFTDLATAVKWLEQCEL